MDNHEKDPQRADVSGQPVRRRTLLGAAGAGAVAAAIPHVGSRPAVATTKPRASAAQAEDLPLIGGEEFPIGIYWPPPPFQTTLERYTEIADAGFNFVITGNYLCDRFILNYACGIADQVGLKMLVFHDSRLETMTETQDITEDGSAPLTISIEDARALLTQVINTYQDNPSFAGVNFYDEPRTDKKVRTLGHAFSLFRELSPGHLPYTNLERGISNNAARLKDFIEVVDPPLISFDHYMLFADGSIDENFFHDWATVREAGLAYDLPTWTYILSVESVGRYRAPTTAEMLWQINVSLAYGCKGIQYFTYWTPDPARGLGFADGAGALMTLDGEPTERYDGAKMINNQWLAPVGKQLKPLVSESVSLANLRGTPPAGLPSFQPDDYVKGASGDAVVIGRFHDRDISDHRWILVANYSFEQPANSRLILGSKVINDGAFEFDPGTEQYESGAARGRRLDVALEPGAARLYRLTTTQ